MTDRGDATDDSNAATNRSHPPLATSATLEASLEEPLLPPPEEPSPENWITDGMPFKTSVLIKSLYFLDALGSSTWGRFSAIYYTLHGLDSRHVGIIEGVRSIIPTVSMVIWGVVADRYHARKLVWLITKSTSTLVLLCLALPVIYNSFVHILLLSILAQVFVSNGILDAYTLDVLGTANKIYYGRYRLYASLSWGLGSIAMGWITDYYGGFEPNFILFGLLGGVMVALVGWQLPEVTIHDDDDDDETEAEDVEETARQESLRIAATTNREGAERIIDATAQNLDTGSLMEIVRLALQPRVFVFLLEVIIMGSGMATVERLLFLYLVNDLQASTTLCGLSVGVNVLFELPIFWYASNFMKTLGHDGMMVVAMLCFVVRVYSYTLLTPSTKSWVLVLESMHGITFACFWVVTTDISKVLVHHTGSAKWRTAIPSSVQMLYSALGVSCGSVVGGWAMHRYGSKAMYRGTATIVAGTLALHIMASLLARLFGKQSFLPSDPPASRVASVELEGGESHPTSSEVRADDENPEAVPEDES